MCLIIHKPQGIAIPADLIRNAWEDNPDGAGIMSRSPAGEVDVYKVVPGSWADPAEHLVKVLGSLTDRDVGVHFRWRTHGPINLDMTHPYPVPESGAWLMHNGVLKTGPDYNPATSDTFHYIHKNLNGAPGAKDDEFWRIVGEDIGAGNKFLLMDADGHFTRVNPGSWKSYKGLFLSNEHSIPELANWKTSSMKRGSRRGFQSVGYSTDYSTGWDSIDWQDREPASKLLTAASNAAKEADRLNTAKPLPARLTRRERKVLLDCLRVGNWGPMSRLGKR